VTTPRRGSGSWRHLQPRDLKIAPGVLQVIAAVQPRKYPWSDSGTLQHLQRYSHPDTRGGMQTKGRNQNTTWTGRCETRGTKNIPLLDGGDGLTTGDDGGEDVALHGDTEGEGNDIEKQEVSSLGGGGLSGKDTGLDGGTVGNSLIGVDALLELLAVEEVAEELLDLRNTGRTANENDLVDLGLLDVGVLEDLGDRVKGAGEGLLVQVLETGTGDVGVEVLTVEQGVDLNGGLGGVGEGTLGTLASSAETAEGTGIARDVLATGLLGELLLEVVEEVAVEVLSTEMGA
jgi:hypothetical protein